MVEQADYFANMGLPDPRQVLNVDCFTVPLWRQAWEVIVATWEKGELACMGTVAHRVCEKFGVEWSHAAMEMTDAIANMPGMHLAAPQWADELRELRIRRELIEFAGDTAKHAYQDPDVEGVLSYTMHAAEALDALRADKETGDMKPLMDALIRKADTPEAKGWASGFRHVDEWSGGLRAGRVFVIGGMWKSGKTWLALQMARTAANLGLTVDFFSLDTDPETMQTRFYALELGVHMFRLQGNGRTWTGDELAAFQEARAHYERGHIRFWNKKRTPAEIAAVVRRRRSHLVIVDYVQLLGYPDRMSEYEGVSKNTKALQTLAQAAPCCMVVLSQIGRESIKLARAGQDVIGGTGTAMIEQVADFWLFVSKTKEGDLKLKVLANRHGTEEGEAVYEYAMGNGGFRDRTELSQAEEKLVVARKASENSRNEANEAWRGAWAGLPRGDQE